MLIGTAEGLLFLDLDEDGWRRGGVLWRDRPIAAVAVDPDTPQRIHVSVAGDGLYKSEDEGRTWERYLWAELSMLHVPPHAPDMLLAAGAPAVVYRSTDRGGFWRPMQLADQPGTGNDGPRVLAMAFDPADGRVAYAGVEGRGIAATFDGGLEWSAVAAQGLPGEVRSLMVSAADPDHLVAGTDHGVVESVDRGFTWSSAAAGMDDPCVLAVASVGGALLAAAHPRPPSDPWSAEPAGRIYRKAVGAARWWPVSERLDGAVGGFCAQSTRAFTWTTAGTVLASHTGGKTWDTFAAGLPPIRALALA